MFTPPSVSFPDFGDDVLLADGRRVKSRLSSLCRQSQGITTGSTSKMLSNWKHRGYITLFSNSLPSSGEELYRKTGLYLKR